MGEDEGHWLRFESISIWINGYYSPVLCLSKDNFSGQLIPDFHLLTYHDRRNQENPPNKKCRKAWKR